jgi:hypothetical protein
MLYKIAKRKGLDGVAITDHESIKGWKTCINEYKHTGDFFIIRGIEKKTELGSIIGIFITENIKVNRFYEVIENIKSQGGIVIVPHPCDFIRRDTLRIRSLDRNTLVKKIDTLEIFNSRCMFNYFNTKAKKLAASLGKCGVGGSDAHLLTEVGNAFTAIECSQMEDIPKLLHRRDQTRITVYGRLSSRLVHLHTLLIKLKV